VADPSPLSRNSSSVPSPSLISQTPMPSTPAAVYARRSSVKLAASVLTCEIENGGSCSSTLDTRSRDRVTRLTSDQVWFTLDPVKSTLESTLSQPKAAVRHRTMAEAALERLREAIILGELTPGTPLRLEDLARSLGMSI